MGGLSVSSMRFDGAQRCTFFEGTVSLANGGGFASVRSQPAPADLTGCDAFILRATGDGKRYKLRVRTEPEFDGVMYEAACEGAAEVHDMLLPFTAFRPVFRGKPVPSAPAFTGGTVWSFGLLIGEKQAGPFRLALYRIDGVECSRSTVTAA